MFETSRWRFALSHALVGPKCSNHFVDKLRGKMCTPRPAKTKICQCYVLANVGLAAAVCVRFAARLLRSAEVLCPLPAQPVVAVGPVGPPAVSPRARRRRTKKDKSKMELGEVDVMPQSVAAVDGDSAAVSLPVALPPVLSAGVGAFET